MPYVDRENGNIVGVYPLRQREGQEYLADDHPDYLAWLQARANKEALAAQNKAQMVADIQANFPSLSVVYSAVGLAFPDAKQNAFMKKLVKVVYWLGKGKPNGD